jgi:3-phenylpropionate/trans-cinnamate dioxygenase ferredoxin subunit
MSAKESTVTRWIRAGSKQEIPPMGSVSVQVDEELKICVARAENGSFFALEDKCSHEDKPICGGPIHGREITCPHHASRFDLQTGKPLNLPAVMPIQTFPVKVEGDDVMVGIVEEEEDED